MKIEMLRLANTIKVDKEDVVFLDRDYDMDAFHNPEIQATMIRVKHKTKKGRGPEGQMIPLVTYTTFANVAYCKVDEGEFKPKAAKPVTKKVTKKAPAKKVAKDDPTSKD
jgi:hypothetical protein